MLHRDLADADLVEVASIVHHELEKDDELARLRRDGRPAGVLAVDRRRPRLEFPGWRDD